MVDTHSIPAPSPAQDRISRDSAQKPAQTQEIRRHTVRRGLREVRGPNGRPVPAPQLHLQGAWLQRAGFHIGVPVKVHVGRRRLVIEPDLDRAPRAEILARVAQVTEGGLTRRDLDALIRRLKRDRID